MTAPLFDGADAKDTHLGLNDDRRLEAAAGGAVVGDGEGAVGKIVLAQLVAAGALGQLVDGTGKAQQVEIAGILDDGHDQAAKAVLVHRQGRGHADVIVTLDDEPRRCRTSWRREPCAGRRRRPR